MFDAILSPIDFYHQTLEANGVKPTDMDLVKIAEAEGRPVEVVKLARAFYEQTQIDNVGFETEAVRKENAYKLAEAYFAQLAEGQNEATKVADDLVRFLKHAAEGYLASNRIELTAEEAVKVAGLQITEGTEEKVAANFGSPSSYYHAGATPAAATADIMGAAKGFLNGAAPQSMAHAAAVVQHAYGRANHPMTPEAAMNTLHQAAMVHASMTNDGLAPSHDDIVNHINGLNQPQEGFISKNKVPLAVGGLGLGAMYLMHKKKQEQEANIRALRVAALPAA